MNIFDWLCRAALAFILLVGALLSPLVEAQDKPKLSSFSVFMTVEKWRDFTIDDVQLPGCTTESRLYVKTRTIEEFVIDCADFSATVKPNFYAKSEFTHLRQGLGTSLLYIPARWLGRRCSNPRDASVPS